MQYAEQLGSKRQQSPSIGDSTTLYARTKKINAAHTIVFITDRTVFITAVTSFPKAFPATTS